MDELSPLILLNSVCYYNIGIALRLSLSELDSIESSSKQIPRRMLTKVIACWLRHKSYSAEKFGPPTWRMLVKAVDSPTGGNDHTLAQKIAVNHPATCSEWIKTVSTIHG